MAIVLIVEEDLPASELLTEALTNAGHEVVAEKDALYAFSFAREHVCDVIITDIRFPKSDHPDHDAFELLSLLRSSRKLTPVIVLSSYVMEEGQQALVKRGFFGALQKPLDNITDLTEMVNNADRHG